MAKYFRITEVNAAVDEESEDFIEVYLELFDKEG